YFELRKMQLPESEVEMILLIDADHPLYFAMNKTGDPELITKIRRAYDKIIATTYPATLRKKYFIE
ncbi:MAG: hypothetical protein K2P84_09805, partial [Undibacterium sp.]|nr:hypothetical protein [Undibacterium sp.]